MRSSKAGASGFLLEIREATSEGERGDAATASMMPSSMMVLVTKGRAEMEAISMAKRKSSSSAGVVI
ncbi:hypothetical protein MLD38_020414 [Melastoma candidum]|uniref:Uncharacterized protein n=1 Tax=Melastoma candidum TaxID=119954 RepID=A0ACB9QCE9_9MYRT|nr:hypothetical protein MLD38_020414 [Melastoma candidum]